MDRQDLILENSPVRLLCRVLFSKIVFLFLELSFGLGNKV